MKRILPVALTCDNNYIKYAGVTIISLLENIHKDTQVDIIVISEQINKNYKQTLTNIVDKYPCATIRFAEISTFSVDQFYLNSDYISHSTYYRFYITEIFSQYERVLYIDCDTVVMSDLTPLIDIPFDNHLLLACSDSYIHHICTTGSEENKQKHKNYFEQTLELDSFRHYFNAGVFVLNIPLAKQINLTEKLLMESQRFFSPLFQDQCILNKVAHATGGVKLIDPKYNLNAYRSNIFNENLMGGVISQLCTPGNKTTAHVHILHYISKDKPWKIRILPGLPFYFYACKSPFLSTLKKESAPVSVKSFIKQTIRSGSLNLIRLFFCYSPLYWKLVTLRCRTRL